MAKSEGISWLSNLSIVFLPFSVPRFVADLGVSGSGLMSWFRALGKKKPLFYSYESREKSASFQIRKEPMQIQGCGRKKDSVVYLVEHSGCWWGDMSQRSATHCHTSRSGLSTSDSTLQIWSGKVTLCFRQLTSCVAYWETLIDETNYINLKPWCYWTNNVNSKHNSIINCAPWNGSRVTSISCWYSEYHCSPDSHFIAITENVFGVIFSMKIPLLPKYREIKWRCHTF